MGVSNLYLLEFNGRFFVPKQEICMAHLSEESLHNCLTQFTRYGAYIQILQVNSIEVIPVVTSSEIFQMNLASQRVRHTGKRKLMLLGITYWSSWRGERSAQKVLGFLCPHSKGVGTFRFTFVCPSVCHIQKMFIFWLTKMENLGKSISLRHISSFIKNKFHHSYFMYFSNKHVVIVYI